MRDHPIIFNHRVKIGPEWQSGWRASIPDHRIESLLPSQIRTKSRFDIPIISGGFLTPFISLQKQKMISKNPYTTKEAYLATIIHELGHVYWNSHKLWWYSNRKQNLALLREALYLYTGKKSFRKFDLEIPNPYFEGELFAFCTEYYSSGIFFKNHKQKLDRFIESRIRNLIELENIKNLNNEDSVIEPDRLPHDFSFVIGKILMTQFPSFWPNILTSRFNLRAV